MRYAFRFIWLVSIALAAGPANAEKRAALVIGNAAYRSVPELPNPRKDARDVAAALKAAAFAEVIERYNLGLREMQQALSQFEDKAAGADWAVVYYAGHGIEVDGRNYLVPIDAQLKRATDVEDETLALDRVLARVAAAGKLQLVILDACREHPFKRRMAQVGGVKRAVGERGLARIEPAHPNVIVAYAARDGEVALDGKPGENSPYARALVKYLSEPGLELGKFFRKVRDDVLAETGGRQRPFEYGSLTGADLFFKPPAAPLQVARPSPAATPRPNEAAEVWAAVKNSTSIAELDVVARRYEGTVYADLARARIEELRKLALAVPPVPKPRPQPGLSTPLAPVPNALPRELVYGNWTPPREYQNVHVMPRIFREIETETRGAIRWKLIAGGQLADGRGTFSAVKDGIMQAGLGIATYAPSSVPSLYAIYSTVVVGHNDVVATTGAAMEVFYLRCPSCLDDFRKINSVPLGGWTSSAYLLACTSPVRSPADLKGKRVRATGGYAELIRVAGGAPVSATLTEAVGLLQRGGLDCHHGIADWLRSFGYADFTKYVTDYPLGITGPAIGFVLNRDTWTRFTLEQKQVHVKWAAWMSAKLAIGNFIAAGDEPLKSVMKDKGVALVPAHAKEWEGVRKEFQKRDRERTIATAKQLGVPDPAGIIDDYEKAIERWRGRSSEIGRDIDRFTDVLMREVYSKIDLSKL